ncbi:hypothetical protein P152DRAFT_26074 [Eremomyces bilateralis CBS 781.70]|uniref:HNH nuclease domain-containing protein n=1 Tax=Eremomyces bilateralis CBS 781.70 TaxID=1392243 RepID=A0A6G1GHU4_9PEZI|nr:uncharacterized protein P152DRAFT_26074 [Eremomyces bilateralis CBS 781.70]KAF1817665.1 hypothetical protein P152DRAFT_26074 [Eremomyces bilateralis CBS 781.70]
METAIFPTGTEASHNLMCLSPNAHAYWGRAYFALKLIRLSDDKKRLDVQFSWLPPRNYTPQVDVLQRPSLPADLDQGPNLVKLFHYETEEKICSGDKNSLETDDPVARPLPDLGILEMQWLLHHVAAMSGAAEPRDDFGGDDDGDIPIALRMGGIRIRRTNWMQNRQRFRICSWKAFHRQCRFQVHRRRPCSILLHHAQKMNSPSILLQLVKEKAMSIQSD